MSDTLYTIKEVADYLKVHWQTVRNYIAQGKLPSSKIGKNIRIREADLIRFSSGNKDKQLLEVEIRFITDKRKSIEEKLIKMDAKLIYHAHVIDHWFVPKNIKNIKQKNESYESGKGFGLRIREQDNGYTGKIITSIESKRLLVPHQHEVCIEGEITVDSYKEAKNFLSLIDQKEFATVDKDRVIYQYGDFKVVFDDIKNYKTAIEIEVKTQKNQEKVIEKIRKFAQKLGLDLEKETTDKSATYLYMQKFAKF